LLVYLTRTIDNVSETILLARGTNYVVATDGPRLTVNVPLQVGDTVTISEYNNTAGNFAPNTPTKLGLYPKYLPEIYLDTTYVNPTLVIRGHDGSITVAFGDIRDQVLLEFEKRIYNNLKTDDNPVPLSAVDVIPGQFRNTGYSQTDINNILGESFLSWVGWNKIDYKSQDYLANNKFTYNYSSAGNRINNQPLLGAWRGIYRYFYDTETPTSTPWEMLGFSEKPDYSFLLRLLNEILQSNNLNNDLCYDWKIVSSQSSLEMTGEKNEKDSETTKIVDKKIKDFEEIKDIFDDTVSSGDETVAYSPRNIKYCKFFYLY
jgi:hypothetical protein